MAISSPKTPEETAKRNEEKAVLEFLIRELRSHRLEHSRPEIQKGVNDSSSSGFSAAAIARAIERLVERNLLESRTRSRGPYFILFGLLEKIDDDDFVSDVIQRIESKFGEPLSIS